MGFSQIGDILAMIDLDEDGIHDRSPSAKRAFADYLRANQTAGERLMGRCLYHLGIDAEPQAVVLGYIADFLDEKRKVVFEVDGSVHETRQAEDRIRDEVMEAAGYQVIRISNEGVRNLMQSIAGQRRAD